MNCGNVSPSKLEQMRLCEARLAGRLNQLGEADWNEEHGEAAGQGTLAHCAAMHWFRPNPAWLKRVRAGENPEPLYAEGKALRNACAARFPAPDIETEDAKVTREAILRAELDAVDEQILAKGLMKHPLSNSNHAFRKAITDCSQSDAVPGKILNELPKDAASVQEARDLFEAIITHYKRDELNIVLAERRYKGTIANGVPIHLIIDLAIDRGQGRLELVDYKTGWIAIGTDDMYSKDQVLMNLLAVTRYDESLKFYPHKSFTYFWARQGFETGPVNLTLDRLIDYEHYLAVMYQYMLNLTTPVESVNRFCASCPRRLGACVRFREYMSEAMGTQKIYTPEELAALPFEEVLGRFDQLKSQIKLLEGAKENLGDYVMRMLQAADKKQFLGEHYKATVRQNRSDAYDAATVLSLCAVNAVDPTQVVSVGKKKVEEKFGTNVEAMRVLGMTMRRGATSPFVDIRELGKKQDAKAVAATAALAATTPAAPPTASQNPA